MGLAGLGIPEELGGAGGGLAELTLVAEELGRALLPVPFLSLDRAGRAGARRVCGRRRGRDVVERLAGGVVVAFAGDRRRRRVGPRPPDRTATQADGGWELSGTVPFVLDGAAAAQLVVAARTPDGCDVFVLAGDADGVQRHAARDARPDPQPGRGHRSTGGRGPAADRAAGPGGRGRRPRSTSRWSCSPPSRWAAPPRAWTWRSSTPRSATSSAGPSAASRRSSTSWPTCCCSSRWAARPIDRALLAQDDPAALRRGGGGGRRSGAARPSPTVATENVHVNGGTGFTWEHDAHLYFRRARADAGAARRRRRSTASAWPTARLVSPGAGCGVSRCAAASSRARPCRRGARAAGRAPARR